MTDDVRLVHATLGGDRAAYGALYDRYAPLVRAMCYDMTRNLACAQDLGQEVFLRAYRNLAGLREPERFAPWLVGITKRVCSEWRRSRARDRHQYVGLAPEKAHSTDADLAGDVESVLKAVAKLPEKERMAVHLFYLQEQGVEQAQAVTGLSRSGFYRVLERARKRLRRAVGVGEEAR